MSYTTISDLKWISGEELAQSVRSKDPGLSIIDVRDDDYIGGHIVGCKNIPVNTHDYRIPELVRTLKDQDVIVFHCSLSQQRGPSSALRYLRERAKMNGKGEISARSDGQDIESGQKVVVLNGGFSRWQQKYGEDSELTEGYVKDLWES